jgi:hypothetical protein
MSSGELLALLLQQVVGQARAAAASTSQQQQEQRQQQIEDKMQQQQQQWQQVLALVSNAMCSCLAAVLPVPPAEVDRDPPSALLFDLWSPVLVAAVEFVQQQEAEGEVEVEEGKENLDPSSLPAYKQGPLPAVQLQQELREQPVTAAANGRANPSAAHPAAATAPAAADGGGGGAAGGGGTAAAAMQQLWVRLLQQLLEVRAVSLAAAQR